MNLRCIKDRSGTTERNKKEIEKQRLEENIFQQDRLDSQKNADKLCTNIPDKHYCRIVLH